MIKSSDYLIYELLTTCRCGETVLARFALSFKLGFTFGALVRALAGSPLFGDLDVRLYRQSNNHFYGRENPIGRTGSARKSSWRYLGGHYSNYISN